ncbi:MAG TPA: hypothetical protein VFN67_17020 [Polyangiales bacterium]|nr:hypothetical protein [Polyangiales bacterium]
MCTRSFLLFSLLTLLGCSKTEPESSARARDTRDDDVDARGASAAAGSTAPAANSGASVPRTLPVSSSGSTPVASGDSCAAISERAQNERKPADIIIAVDNSGSMDEEIVFVREQLNAFSQQIIAAGVDARIILISSPIQAPGATMPANWFDDDDDQDNGICIAAPLGSGSCPDDTNLPRYVHVPEEVSSHDALDMFISTYAMWQAHLRPNATKTFLVVTDDDAEDRDDDNDEGGGSAAAPRDMAAWFREQVGALPGGQFPSFTFSGIYCFSECPEAAAVGAVYEELVQLTMGVKGDLCEQNFAPVFDALAKAVVDTSGLECSWAIPAAPSGETFDRDRVNVQYSVSGSAAQSLLRVADAAACGGRSGWHYDDAGSPTRIVACANTCAELQQDPEARVDVLFGCGTQQAPE